MPDVEPAPVADGAASRLVDRRTLLVGAAGELAAAGEDVGKPGVERQPAALRSIAGAAGGYALVTTVQDPRRAPRGPAVPPPATLRSMRDLGPAQGEGGLDGYGLGIERRALPGGTELIGHLGGTAGYRPSSAACDPSAWR
jgi:hypothetical protein